jgi:hypothetical protein
MRNHRLAQGALLALSLLFPSLGLGGAPIDSGSVPIEISAAPITDAARAMAAFDEIIGPLSHPEALHVATGAYFAHRDAHPDEVRKPWLYFVDFGLDNTTPRGWVLNMDDLTVVDGPFTVAHGRGSSSSRNGVPTRFSNVSGSNATSLGLFVAEGTYGFRGTSSGRAYQSVGLRLRGESDIFNDAALARGIVVHGAPYVTAGDAGRSEGCPAMEMERAQRLLPELANGGVVFLYSPLADEWLSEGPWAAP